MSKASSLVIVGTGLLGTSLAMALGTLRKQGKTIDDLALDRVIGVGRRLETLEQARQTGAYDELTDDLLSVISKARVLMLATPLSAFGPTLERIADHIHEDLIITDVGSTKVGPCQAAKAHLHDHACFVGAHPMAGSEQQGPAAGDRELFVGKPCVICREPETHEDFAQAIESLWEAVGMHIVRLTPAEHDRQVAAISHLPHAAAVMLIQVAQQMGGWDVASTGFRDTTRLASSNPLMRRDIMLENREAIRVALEELRRCIDAMEDHLDQADESSLLAMLERVREQRDEWLSGDR